MTFSDYVALASALLSFAVAALVIVAPKTKTTVDDVVLEVLKKLQELESAK